MERRRRGFARGKKCHQYSSNTSSFLRESCRPEQTPSSLGEQSLQPPGTSREGAGGSALQAEGAKWQGHDGPHDQHRTSYRGRGGRRGGPSISRTDHQGDSREYWNAEGGAAVPGFQSLDASVRGKSWRSDHGRFTKSKDNRRENERDWHSKRDIRGGRGREADFHRASFSTAASHDSGAIARSPVEEGAFGTKGKPLIVNSNFFAIEQFKKDVAFHYDITFIPDRPKKLLRLVFNELKKIYFPDQIIAFDGVKNAYSMTCLVDKPDKVIEHKIKVFNEDKLRENEFKVSLKLVARVDLSSINQKCIQVLEVVLRSAAAMKYISVGRSFFSFNNPPIPLMDGLVVRSGLHLNVKEGQLKLYVNFDSVHKAFHKAQSVIGVIEEMFGSLQNKSLQDRDIYLLKNMLKGMKVTYSIPSHAKSSTRVYTVVDVSKPPCHNVFEHNGTITTVEEYFTNVKRYPLKYRNLPCLKLGPSVNVPIELCSIVEGQAVQKQLSDKQSGKMINETALCPSERMQKIDAEVKYLDLPNSPITEGFGIKVNPIPQLLEARVLESPELQYNNGHASPQNGVWHSVSPFLQGASVEKWTILILDRCIEREEAYTFSNQLIKEGKEMGLTINEPHPCKSLNTKSQPNVQNVFLKELTNFQNFDLVIVVGYKSKEVYAALKKIAELKFHVCTQYITSFTLRKRKDYEKIIHNIVQKVNAKLGGVNHALRETVVPTKFSKASVMYVGADVTHPSFKEAGSPSVAAVCASHDALGFQYNTQICVQQSKVEIITDLEKMMMNHLKVYEKNMRKKPEIILFFRDGVGEGQFQEVREKELTAIQRACSTLGSDYKPKITFLVVQKRHHARFFPVEQNSRRERNVPPGTIIDHTITNPKDREFYLVSHNSPRGVSRPCRYHCLWDDNNLSSDELQEMAFFQCFMYSRCEQSVSYPVPTYYAHHAAARGKLYLLGENYRGCSNQVIENHSDNLQKLPAMFFV